jgi:hypothetical protein
MQTIEQSIEVNVPLETAYNQWTQFEEFPQFMEGVESVTQLDDTHLRWVAEIAGKRREWKAEITGVGTFHRIDPTTTRIMLQMDWEPEGAVEQVGAAVGADDRRVKGDLGRFKELIESRGQETGAWRGDVERGETAKTSG